MVAPRTSILFLSADPTDASRLRLGQELRDIQTRLRLANASENFDLHNRASVRPGDLSQAIFDTKPAIIHFSGHGSPAGELLLENDAGQVHPVEPEALEALFSLFKDDVRCVILNACYSSKQAGAISKHIDNVIGMTKAIGDNAAITFSVGFYKALGAGRAVHECFEFGRTELRLHNISEHQTPVLLRRHRIGHIYLAEEQYIGYQERKFPSEYEHFAKLFLDDGKRKGCILIDPEAYDCLGHILDDIYMNYLRGQVPILSYGSSWLIYTRQLIVPWEWLSEHGPMGYQDRWVPLRNWAPADVGLGRGGHGTILLSEEQLTGEGYILLATNNPQIYDIARSRGKATLVLFELMRKVPMSEFDGDQYRYKLVIYYPFDDGGTRIALVDTGLSEVELIRLEGFLRPWR